MSHFDSKFFTNEPGSTLYDRFKLALQHTKYFDVLVGYFRASGFYRLKDAFENIDKVRILVGLNVDKNSYDAIRKARSVESIRTHEVLENETENATVLDIQGAEDDGVVEQGILKIKFDNGRKNDCPLQGLGFCTQFKNTFAFLVNIVTDSGLCKPCILLCVRSHDPQR